MKTNWPIIAIQMVALVMVCELRVEGQTKPPETRKADTTKYTIENCLNEFSKDQIEKTEAGYQYWFVNKDLADGKTLKMSVVKPHSATHAPHSHVEEEFFFVLEGRIEFYLNGQRKVVGPFSSLYCPSNVEHGIRNVGDTEAKYLVVKKYEKK
ncbi:MAG: cupin domain-containing protein [Ignavibacteriales bacterium]|nr:cupin domain-containing protein [Ignavibacteriales bacterium]